MIKLNLLKNIDHSVKGVFWITESKLSPQSDFFLELDYLSNGQFSKIYARSKGQDNKLPQLVETSQFDRPFFIAHLRAQKDSKVGQGQSITSEINSLVDLKENQLKDNDIQSKLLVISELDKDKERALAQELSKRDSHIKFISLQNDFSKN